ncbi:L-2-hydroxyglutarate oxidase [bacterium]|nr:L-2-hydroxyglutarate oxidase [bacterium]
MSPKTYDVVVIGGGIVGLATAMALSKKFTASVLVIEAEKKLSAHQTGNNSGVIHSGLYYKPGSLKALNCVAGREAMYRFCREHQIPVDRCGKVVVATQESELPALQELERRGLANGLKNLRRLNREEMTEYEHHVAGIAGLHVEETGIVDYLVVSEAFSRIIQENGEVRTGTRFLSLKREQNQLILNTNQGDIACRNLINCGGLQSDRIARRCGVKPGLQIIPFRGEYYEVIKEKHYLINHLIYPVPDPRFPFLGVHFTRMIKGGREAGPNAVLSFKREGYHKTSFSLVDTLQFGLYGGFWLMALKFWKMGLGEFYRSFNKKAFVSALQRLVPAIGYDDVIPGGAGVRAQALEPDGALVDDFRIVEVEHQVHVLNAPSPAATASISIGESIADMAAKNFGLSLKK